MRIALLFMLAHGAVFANTASPPIVGTYGSLRYVEEAGDVVGTVIAITQRGNEFEVDYQEAEGEPGKVVHVPAVVEGATISFQLPPLEVEEWNGGKRVGKSEIPRPLYRGTITNRGLKGGFVGSSQELLLRQRKGGKGVQGK